MAAPASQGGHGHRNRLRRCGDHLPVGIFLPIAVVVTTPYWLVFPELRAHPCDLGTPRQRAAIERLRRTAARRGAARRVFDWATRRSR